MSRPFAARRALTPVVGVALLAVLTVLAAALVAGTLADARQPRPAPQATLSASASTDGQVTLVHEEGDALRVGALRVRVAVDGTSLRHQPPVPFVGATGFDGAPSGSFNPRADGRWTAGERGCSALQGRTPRSLDRGSRLCVTGYASCRWIATAETTVAARAATLPPPARVRPRPPPARSVRRGPSPAS